MQYSGAKPEVTEAKQSNRRKGFDLPFFSCGGTAHFIQLTEMGIILSTSREIPAVKAG